MHPRNIYKTCKPIILSALLLISIGPIAVLAQGKPSEPNGYDKASYNASQGGNFLKTWLVAGPFPVSADTLEPGVDLQEKVFKADILSSVNVVPGNSVPAVEVNQKD